MGTNTDSARFPIMTLKCYTDLSCSDAARIHVCPKLAAQLTSLPKPAAQLTALGSIPLARSTAPGAACKTRHDTARAGRRRVPHNVHVGLRIRSVRALLRLWPVGRQGVLITMSGVPRWHCLAVRRGSRALNELTSEEARTTSRDAPKTMAARSPYLFTIRRAAVKARA